MINKKENQDGLSVVISMLILAAILAFGWLVVSRFINSESGQKLQNSGSETIDDATDKVDKVKEAEEKANQIIQ